MTKKETLKKNGLIALVLGVLLEVLYLMFFANSDSALMSMIGTALGLAGPIFFIYGLIQIIRGFIAKDSTETE